MLPALLDSGSCLNLISFDFLKQNKKLFMYKTLGNRVKIFTLNSVLQIHSCIEFSFKIDKSFYKATFYETSFPNGSKFQLILGFDFFKKHNVQFQLSKNVVNIDDQQVALSDSNILSHEEIEQSLCTGTFDLTKFQF